MASYLYLLHMTGTDLYKIGVSCRPCKRLEQIAGKEYPVQIVRVWPGLAEFERELHRRYGAHRVAGDELPVSGRTEWFRFGTEQVTELMATCYCERLRSEERERARKRARFEDE